MYITKDTLDCLNAGKPKPKKNKYNAQKIIIDGHKFDSKKEGVRYQELKFQEHCGLIRNLELQPRLDIYIGQKYIAFYRGDFKYKKSNQVIVEDVKSAITKKNPVYRLKKKLIEAIYKISILET